MSERTYNLPDTQLRLGMRVDPKAILTPWARRQILYGQIREFRRISVILEEYGEARRGRCLTEGAKASIRECMYVVDHAYSAEVCGIIPMNTLVRGTVANVCYIRPGQSHGGIQFYAHILFRAIANDEKCNNVAFIPEDAVWAFPEHLVVQAKIPEE